MIARQLTGRLGRGLRLATGACLLLLAAGCRPRVAPTSLPPAATAPVALPSEPEGKISGVVPPVPTVPTPLPRVAVSPPKPKRVRRRAPPAVASATPPPPMSTGTPSAPPASTPAAPAQGAPPPAAPEAIGALSSGAPSDPALIARTTELLADLKKRVDGLPASVLADHADGVTRVRLFYREAETALKSGDADGAWTLATKARVLLDELTG